MSSDMVELCGLKQESKGAPTPITKATGKGRGDIDDDMEPHDVQTFRQAAGTGLYLSISSSFIQFAMSVVKSGMSEPKVVHQLQAVRVARYVLQRLRETWLFNYQADPNSLYVYTDTDWAADELIQLGHVCSLPGVPEVYNISNFCHLSLVRSSTKSLVWGLPI